MSQIDLDTDVAGKSRGTLVDRLLSRRVRIATLVVMLLAGIVSLALLGNQVRKELRTLRHASFDNVQWSLSQLEVDLLVFQRALDNAHHDDSVSALKNIRRRFNVLFSRQNTLSTGTIYEDIRQDPKTGAALVRLREFMLAQVAIIDGPDAILLQNIGAILNETEQFRSDARYISLNGKDAYARRSGDQRELISALLTRTSLLTVAMIILLGGVSIVLIRQIGETKRESFHRKLTNARLNSVVGASLDAIIVANQKGTVLDFNEAATKIFGYSREEALGKKAYDLIMPERYREKHKEGLRRYRETGDGQVVDAGLFELKAVRKDGTELPLEVSVASSDGPNGKVLVSFLRDISDHKRAQWELTKARDEALAADRAKSDFLAVMSHEMRTPLNGIMGTLDLLAAGKMDSKQRRYVEVAQSSSNHLLRHINDVLDISKVDANKLQLSDDVFTPLDLVREVADANKALAEARGSQITVQSDLDADIYIIADRFRICQALINLLGNAIKFTANGQIEIGVTEITAPDGKRAIEFRVTDTGIGISDDQLGKIFEDFVTIDTSYTRRTEGTGLGLGISRRMARAMGGDIGAESIMGEGSSFWFYIPMILASSDDELAAEKAAIVKPSSVARSLSILLVEDNQINRFVARELLELLGHKVYEAHDGHEGVLMAESQNFDVILMDISMPVMDGVTATQRIRASDGKSSGSTIIGLTAHTQPGERARFRKAGMQECLTKPIDMAKLHDVLDRATGVETELPRPDLMTQETRADLIRQSVLDEMKDLMGPERFSSNLKLFAAEMKDCLSVLSDAKNDNELPNVEKVVHKLMGSAGTFGAARLKVRLSAVELACQCLDFDAFDDARSEIAPVWKATHAKLTAANDQSAAVLSNG